MPQENTPEDFFIHHAALILRQELGISAGVAEQAQKVGEARFKAWCEGPEGYAERLKTELDMIKEGCYD